MVWKNASGLSDGPKRTNTSPPCSKNFVTTSDSCLRGRLHLGLQRSCRVLRKSPLIHMANHPNHNQGYPGTLNGIGVELKNFDVLADRVLAGKVFVREAAID